MIRRVAIVSDTLWGGGAEKLANNLFQGLLGLGVETRLFCGSLGVLPIRPEISIRTRVNASGQDSLRALRAHCDALTKDIESFKPDVVHFHNIHESSIPPHYPFFINRRIPTVWTFHDLCPITGGCALPLDCRYYESGCRDACLDDNRPERYYTNKVSIEAHYEIMAKCWKSANPPYIVVPSAWMEGRIRCSPLGGAATIRVIPNGIDTTQFLSASGGAIRERLGISACEVVILVLAASFTNNSLKAPDDALSIMERIPKHLRFSIIWMGHGAERFAGLSKSRCPSFSLPYSSNDDEIAAAYAASDIYLMPSHYENYPTTIMEAMTSRCAVLARSVGGIPEQIDHERTGLLFSDVEDAAKQLAALLDSPQSRENIRNAARKQAISSFGLEKCLTEHRMLYEELAVCAPRTENNLPSISSFWDLRREMDVVVIPRQDIQSFRDTISADRIKEARLVRALVTTRMRLLQAKHSNARIALFANGQHTNWLLSLLKDDPHLLAMIKVIFDEAQPQDVVGNNNGIPVAHPTSHCVPFDIVIPSSDVLEDKLSARIATLFGDSIGIWRLYEGLPPGPYHKASPQSAGHGIRNA